MRNPISFLPNVQKQRQIVLIMNILLTLGWSLENSYWTKRDKLLAVMNKGLKVTKQNIDGKF